MAAVTCPDCGAAVELKVMREPGERRRPFLVDADGSGCRRHYCPPPELDTEQIDRCLTCMASYVRINGGERLDLATRTPHVCQPVAPVVPPRVPDPPRQVSVGPQPILKEGGTVPGHVPTIAARHRVIDL